MSEAKRVAVGTELGGYRLEAFIGRGGMGAVYRAAEPGLGRKVAVKVIASELAEDPRFRERFLHESRVAASLDHPHVVPIFLAGEEEGALFIVMRYVDGTDLARLLDGGAALEPTRAVALLEQVAEALDAAHDRALVHRDVKPSNVLIAASGGEHCYLADFGLTKRMGSLSGMSAPGDVVGTLEYVAPEQITGAEVGPAADVYSFGCVLYECLTGQSPFPRATDVALLWAHAHEQPAPVSEVRPELPSALDAVLARALAKDPAARHAGAGELVADVRAALAPVARPSSVTRRVAAVRRGLGGRRRALLAGVAAVVVLAVAAGVLLIRPPASGLARVKPNHVGVLDPATNEVVAEVPVGIAPGPIEADGSSIWVANVDDRTLTRVDLERQVPVATISLDGRTPTGIATGHGAVWVAHGRLGQLSRVDPEFGRVELLDVDAEPSARGSVAAGAGAVWAVYGDSTLVRVDPKSGLESGKAIAGAEPSDVGVFRGDVWVVNSGEGDATVARYRPRTFQEGPIDVASVGFRPEAIAYGEDAVWVVNADEDTVTRVDPDTGSRTIPVGDEPTAVAVGEGAVWVANTGDGTVSRVDPASGDVRTIEIGGAPTGIAVARGLVWISTREREVTSGTQP